MKRCSNRQLRPRSSFSYYPLVFLQRSITLAFLFLGFCSLRRILSYFLTRLIQVNSPSQILYPWSSSPFVDS